MSKDNPNITYDELKKRLESYLPGEDLALVTKAYMYAYEHHFGIKRLTGEDYITHPLNVANILVDINADSATICAALLHDVIEDCGVTKEELEEKFGTEIAFLVDGVTKINRLNFAGDNESVIANHRKILVGLSEDVRVIIIKLADRLHNMRTLWALPEKRQKAKARETLDILTPIAHRLGIFGIKSELEDLCLRYYKPDVYFDILEKLNQSKADREEIVTRMKQALSDLLKEHNIKHEIKGRAKSVYSIYKKLDKGKKWSELFDLLGLRVFVDTEEDCYRVLGIIHSKYRPIPKRFKDYIAMPKTNMYQSLHTTVFGLEGYQFEIQIRTYEMDEVAENGIAAHWSYKEKGSNSKALLQNAMEQKLQFFKAIIELKNEEKTAETFVESVKADVLKDSVYVFTPKGDVIELPNGSTPIDFAYRVHGDVGDKMVGAVVNGGIVPFDYKLKSNDIIKINTNKNSFGPNREWIDIAYTQQAKNKIKSFFNKLDKSEYLKNGEELLSKELRKKKIAINEFLSNENVDRILNEFKFTDLNELYTCVGNGKVTPTAIINFSTNNSATKAELVLNKAINQNVVKPNVKNDIIVDGIDKVKVNVASCCRPIPGDRIVGYITKGYGITVHRMVCPNVAMLDERLINVHWNENISKKFPTSVLIYASENNNLLLDIIAKTSNSDIMVQSVNTINCKDNFLFDLTILVENKEMLVKFMNDIEQMPSVIRVERAIK